MDQAEARKTLRELLDSRQTGVLATSRGDRPYLSIVAFAVSDDLGQLIFATPRHGRKYENLKANPNVAMLMDNRANDAGDIRDAVAATAIGRAFALDMPDREAYLDRYAARQPHLADFARSDSTAVFRISVEKYIMVSRFQDVLEINV